MRDIEYPEKSIVASGNGLYLALPKLFCDLNGIKKGSRVRVIVTGSDLSEIVVKSESK